MGLVRLGFEPGETVSILSNTNREWMYADMGALGAGGVTSGIYPTDSASQVEYLLADSRSVYVFVEDEEQLDKVLEVRERLPRLRRIVVFDMEGLQRFSDPMVISLEELRRLGFELHQKRTRRVESTTEQPKTPGPGDPDLHLGHDRQAEGRDDLARQRDARHARQRADAAERRGRRAHVLPAAVPRRRAHRRGVPRDVLRRGDELRREARDRAGERARDRARPGSWRCRASGRSSTPRS